MVFGTIKDQLETIAAPLGGFVTAVSKVTDMLAAAVFNGIDSLNATTVEAINIGTAGNINGGVSGKPSENDFISRPGGGITSFSSQDTIVGAKSGGPIDQMLASAGGNGGTSIITVKWQLHLHLQLKIYK